MTADGHDIETAAPTAKRQLRGYLKHRNPRVTQYRTGQERSARYSVGSARGYNYEVPKGRGRKRRGVAQLGSALRSGRRGPGFESRLPDHISLQ